MGLLIGLTSGQFGVLLGDFFVGFVITLGIARYGRWPKTGPRFWQQSWRFYGTVLVIALVWNSLAPSGLH